MSDKETQSVQWRDWCYNEYQDAEWVPAPCQKACPVGTDSPSYIGLIWKGQFEEAFEAITATNPFASVCGRVCANPCETACRRGESDAPVAIRNLKRFVMDKLGHNYHPPQVCVTKRQTVGIVGGGPCGLTAAQDLAEAGYEVHIYEMSSRLGGMMNVIPEFRLPRDIVDDDINRLLEHCPGIKTHLNTSLGESITMQELKAHHDAVLVSIGLWRDRRLGIPGEEDAWEGLHGVSLMTDLRRGSKADLPERVVVLGGGNVAMDMARTAVRLGAKHVDIYCLESKQEMPVWKQEIEFSEREGIGINTSWGPKKILVNDGTVTGVDLMRCISVFDAEGHFRPVYDRDITKTVETRAVLLAIGLEADNQELDDLGMIDRGLVKAEYANMGTPDPKVFAAGDCALGPSSIVYAMGQGHRVAYYIEAFLERRVNPLPYRIPYRTRAVEIAKDPMWERLPREEQPFYGTSMDHPAFAECESTYDMETAKSQSARCLRCDAETGSSNYSRRTREHIQAMARTDPTDIDRLRAMALERLKPRNDPFPEDRPAHIDDLVFLSAALTRLVIDPYREFCDTSTRIGRFIDLGQPFFFTGFDDAPTEVREALSRGLQKSKCGYIGFRPLQEKGDTQERMFPWLQLILQDRDEPHADADGLIYIQGKNFHPFNAQRHHEDQLIGMAVAAPALEQAVPWALEHGFDMLLLDGTSCIEKPWSELNGHPDLTVMRDAIRILRHKLKREEDIALVYFGGMRSGTDVAKTLAINCNAAVFNVALAIALGGVIEGETVTFNSGLSIEERYEDVENWIEATAEETAIIARCTGKTNVHNLEPEDMRSITIATSRAMDIPMASGDEKREGF